MGTRCDFYVQIKPGKMRIKDWRGSLGWDGYPGGLIHEQVGNPGFFGVTRTSDFLAAIKGVFAKRDDFTHPDMGYPWPWNDSWMTDFAYVFNEPEHRVDVYFFGKLLPPEHWYDEPHFNPETEKVAIFPDMTSKQNVTLGPRSGLTVVQGGKVVNLP